VAACHQPLPPRVDLRAVKRRLARHLGLAVAAAHLVQLDMSAAAAAAQLEQSDQALPPPPPQQPLLHCAHAFVPVLVHRLLLIRRRLPPLDI
jgi:hypothetical protein